MKESPYFKDADLMVRVLPYVMKQRCFALKGGTAINLFIQDMPRLSVDIDLTYLPIESREDTLRGIESALKNIARDIEQALPQVSIRMHHMEKPRRISKLTILWGEAKVKVEPNEVFRATVFPVVERELAPRAKELFRTALSVPVISTPDLYGGKCCAALDRQHPRDLFDLKILFEHGGITDEMRKAFVVYLASSNRPMHELLHPQSKGCQGNAGYI
jgi:predicted nucleotidyltransferase component of viral defense system